MSKSWKRSKCLEWFYLVRTCLKENIFFTVLKHAENNNGCIKLGLHTSLLMPFNLTTIIITIVDSKNISKHGRIKQTLSVLYIFFNLANTITHLNFPCIWAMRYSWQFSRTFVNYIRHAIFEEFAKFLVSYFSPQGMTYGLW